MKLFHIAMYLPLIIIFSCLPEVRPTGDILSPSLIKINFEKIVLFEKQINTPGSEINFIKKNAKDIWKLVIDAKKYSSAEFKDGLKCDFPEGDYEVKVKGGGYSVWSKDDLPIIRRTGSKPWSWLIYIDIPAISYEGILGKNMNFYDSKEEALKDNIGEKISFSLNKTETVWFWINDPIFSDNRGEAIVYIYRYELGSFSVHSIK